MAKKKAIIITVIVALGVLLVGGAVLGIVLYMNKDIEPFDYVNEDLGKYIYISDASYTGYKGYEVRIATDEITDDTVTTYINRILASKRGETSNGGKQETLATVAVGDDVNLFFRAYMNDENGVPQEVSALSNFTVTTETARTYTVGGGSLDTLGLRLELALVGCDLSQYASCEIVHSGSFVKETDMIYITYDALYDGVTAKHGDSVCIDLSDESVNAELRSYLIGKAIGATLNPTVSFKDETGATVRYKQITIDRAMRFPNDGQEPFKVTTTVPATYSDVSMQGKEVTFELYIDYAIKYNVPELDETFIKETLEMTDEELAPYSGESTVDRFRSYILAYLKSAEEAEVNEILVEAMWSHLYNIAEIKKLPEDEVERLYLEYKTDIERAYEENPGDYASLDEYANAYVSYLGGSTVWTDYFRSEAEAEVKHKLIFYYIARAEGLLPTDEEFDALAQQIVENDLASYLLTLGIEREDYETDSEYEAAVAPYRAEVEATFADEEYLRWVVHLEFAEEKMSKFARVSIINAAG